MFQRVGDSIHEPFTPWYPEWVGFAEVYEYDLAKTLLYKLCQKVVSWHLLLAQ